MICIDKNWSFGPLSPSRYCKQGARSEPSNLRTQPSMKYWGYFLLLSAAKTIQIERMKRCWGQRFFLLSAFAKWIKESVCKLHFMLGMLVVFLIAILMISWDFLIAYYAFWMRMIFLRYCKDHTVFFFTLSLILFSGHVSPTFYFSFHCKLFNAFTVAKEKSPLRWRLKV